MICFASGHSNDCHKKINFFNALTAVRFACETFTVLRDPLGAGCVMKGLTDGQA